MSEITTTGQIPVRDMESAEATLAAMRRPELPELETEEEWSYFTRAVWEKVETQEKTLCAMKFMLGDLWNMGLGKFGEDACYQLAADMNIKPATLMNVARVARNIPRDNRRPEVLTFRHHEEVAGMTKEPWAQVQWLDRAEKEELTAGELRRNIRLDTTHIPDGSREEWELGTPAWVLDAVRETFGGPITLDPCSTHEFNKLVQAEHVLTIEDDGLSRDWWGNVYCFPPYGRDDDWNSLMELWVPYAIEQVKLGNVEQLILNVHAFTGDGWFSPLWDYPICFSEERIKYYRPRSGLKTAGVRPRHATAIVYMGPNIAAFQKAFENIGQVAYSHRLLSKLKSL